MSMTFSSPFERSHLCPRPKLKSVIKCLRGNKLKMNSNKTDVKVVGNSDVGTVLLAFDG